MDKEVTKDTLKTERSIQEDKKEGLQCAGISSESSKTLHANQRPLKVQDCEEQQPRCAYYIVRKNRPCQMLVKKGNKFCGQHLVADEQHQKYSQFKRIPCPLDPQHSCYSHRLESHLNHCNANKKNDQPFFKKDINIGEAVEENPPRILLTHLSDQQLLDIIEKVNQIHKEYVGDIALEILCHEEIKAELDTISYGSTAWRHLIQNASILGHLKKISALNNDCTTAYVELGAGRGQLTKWLTTGVSDKQKAAFVLVDRGAQRYKRDAKLRYNKSLTVTRLRVDIQHLDLSKVELIQKQEQVVLTGKHLCGAATDLALWSISRDIGLQVQGLVISLCCHHHCNWRSYTGKAFLKKVGFSSEEFPILLALSSWATCGAQDQQEKMQLQGEQVITEPDHILLSVPQQLKKGELLERACELNSEGNLCKQGKEDPKEKSMNISEIEGERNRNEKRYERLHLNAKLRESIGRKVKQILDVGRVRFVEGLGLNCKLIQYVSENITLENIALVACQSMFSHQT